MKTFTNSRWAPLMAYLLIALALAVYLERRDSAQAKATYKDQVAACERGNNLRRESNDRAVFNQAQLDTLRSFIEGAKNARQAAYDRDGNKEDLKAAVGYAADLRSLQGISYGKEPLVECAEVFELP